MWAVEQIVEAIRPFAPWTYIGRVIDAVENMVGRPLYRSEKQYVYDELHDLCKIPA